jgi:hypothetical protein
MNSFTPICAVVVLAAGLMTTMGCQQRPEADGTSSLYFTSPEQSVDQIKSLVGVAEWETLGRYYDLTGSGLTRAEVTREDFYVRKPPYAPAQPASIGRFKRLFPTAFTFESAEPGGAADTVIVTVGVAIDQGGGPVQRVRSSYRLRKSASGYQLLPEANP